VNVDRWIKDVREIAGSEIFIALIGNKLNLAEQRKVQTEEAQTHANEHNIIYVETSAKTGENIAGTESFRPVQKRKECSC
jgi:GTPase SAR1 family protein